MAAEDHYIYTPLNWERKEIRVLLVHPWKGSPDESIQGSLTHFSLLDSPCPEYETISYVWGDPSIRSHVIINNTRLEVPASAEEMLRQMRYANQDRSLWIDAVCINQQDLAERGHQVSIMADIYSNTKKNLIWLGWDHSLAPAWKAFEAIVMIVEDAGRETKGSELISRFVWDVLPQDDPDRDRVRVDKPLPASIDYAALRRLFASAWFRRLWGE
jgi:hypothetical protein